MSMINIGLSGLVANQVAMNVTAQNTANINTDGYSRRVVDQSSVVLGQQVGGLNVGGGVQVASIRRVTDQALVSQLRLAGEDMQYSQVFYQGMSNIENVFGMEGLNITTGLNEFFSSVDEAAISPQSSVYRQQIISSAEALAGRFNGTIDALRDKLDGLDQQVTATTAQVNSQLSSIAQLNKEIQEASALGKDISGFQDSLDIQVAELSKSIGVNTMYKPDGSVELSTPNGQPLVINDMAATISRNDASGEQYDMSLQLTFQNTTTAMPNSVGGELGAMQDLKNKEYLPSMEALNDMASAFADEVNATLTAGIDLNGNPGKPLFSYDPLDPAGSIGITDIKPSELGLSSDGNIGNGDNALALAELAQKPLAIGGENINIYNAYSQLLGDVGIATRQASSQLNTATVGLNQAQAARDNVSAVNSDEEAANLMIYMNAYQANMKVISTANQMFDTMLNSF